MKKPFYITTTLPYVNSDPHVGFALEIVRADTIARYKKQQGHEVFFNTGTDEHGQKIFTAAQKEGITPQAYVDRFAATFRALHSVLSISEDIHFIRTTDASHIRAAQAFWTICAEKGFIYKKNYKGKYCVGCELEKTDSELDDNGYCPLHPITPLEFFDEENYFFAYSRLAERLADLYEKNPTIVIPAFRLNELRAFLSRGLQDFSISRLKEKMPWGIEVPGDSEHVMYVWFDALVNYISTLGWPEHTELFTHLWQEGTVVQYCGKDNTRQQGMMWQAMLLAAGLPTTQHIVVNGFITSNGQKMSKSLGNVISPFAVHTHFLSVVGGDTALASDIVRYYLLRHMNSFEDTDMTLSHMEAMYTAGLVNGLGNVVSRIMTLSMNHCEKGEYVHYVQQIKDASKVQEAVESALEEFDIQKAMNILWGAIATVDTSITTNRPFSVIKEHPEEGKKMINELVAQLAVFAEALVPFMPSTARSIQAVIEQNKKPDTPLFARLSHDA